MPNVKTLIKTLKQKQYAWLWTSIKPRQADSGISGPVQGGSQKLCRRQMSPGNPPSRGHDRPLVEPVRISDVERPPIDQAESSKPPDDADGVVRCDVPNMEQCRTDSPQQGLGWNADAVVITMHFLGVALYGIRWNALTWLQPAWQPFICSTTASVCHPKPRCESVRHPSVFVTSHSATRLHHLVVWGGASLHHWLGSTSGLSDLRLGGWPCDIWRLYTFWLPPALAMICLGEIEVRNQA